MSLISRVQPELQKTLADALRGKFTKCCAGCFEHLPVGEPVTKAALKNPDGSVAFCCLCPSCAERVQTDAAFFARIERDALRVAGDA
jgi:hypothetical protein